MPRISSVLSSEKLPDVLSVILVGGGSTVIALLPNRAVHWLTLQTYKLDFELFYLMNYEFMFFP